MGVTTDRATLRRYAGAALPLVLLALLVGWFLYAPPLSGGAGEPLPQVDVSHTTLPDSETVRLHVVNSGPEAVTVSQVLVDDAYWDFTVSGGQTLAPMERATVTVPYHWEPGWDLGLTLVLSGGATVHHTVVAPQPTPAIDAGLLGDLALVGLLVGVIPVGLGMLWFPAMRDLADRWLHAVLAFAVGVLGFLAVDAGFEALEVAESVPGAYEGHLLVAFGALGTLLLVQSVGSGRGSSPLGLAYLVALGIGLHNLAEGLAIGSAYALGRASLGATLVVGFMVHNVTEGPAVVAPVAEGERPALKHFLALGALAGAPVVLGGWIGSAAYSPTLGALFIAVGVGAILQVCWEMGGMIRDRGRLGTATNLLAAGAGLAVMYATDLLVAL